MLLLYMSSNENVGLFEQPCHDNEIILKQLSGEFSLNEFIINDISSLSCCQYLAIDLSCLTDSDNQLIDTMVAIKSMYALKIIILAIGYENNRPILGRLFAEGIYNIITSTRLSAQQDELSLCLVKGMQYKDAIKYRLQSDTDDAVKKKKAFKPKMKTKTEFIKKHTDAKVAEEKHSLPPQKKTIQVEQKEKDDSMKIFFYGIDAVLRAIGYIVLFLLSSIGLTALINEEIREIIYSLF